jgi:exonuclease SbcC
MLIRSVHLENFKSYEQATVHFMEGTNAIVGRNGAGKSSLVEAIGYALFDYTSASRQGDLLREGASSGRVVVRFFSSYDEREYEVERVFGKNGTTRHRIFDGENQGVVLAESVSEVRQWLREHLGIERDASTDDLFRNTIGVPQGSFTAPFLLAAGERKRIFDPLLQVDEYERAFQNLRETGRYLGDQLAALEQEIARLEGQIEQLPRHQEELAEVAAAIEALTAQAQALEAALRAARAALRELDQAEQAVRQAEKAHADAGYQVQAAEGERRQAQDALDEAARAREQVAAAEPGYRAYLAAEERLRTLEAERTARDRARRARDQAALEQTRLAAQQSQARQALDAIQQAAIRLDALRPQAEEQQRLDARLDEARMQAQLLPEAQRQAQAAQAAIDEAQARLERILAGLQRAGALENELAQIEGDQEALAERERQRQGERSAMQAELARIHEQSEALARGEGARCPTCEAELTPAHRQELLERNRQRTQELQSALAEADREIKTATQQRAQAQKRAGELGRTLRNLPTEENRQEQQQQIERSIQALAEQQARIAELTTWAESAQSLSKQLQALGDPLSEARVLAARVSEREGRQAELARLDRAVADLDGKLAQLETQVEQYVYLDEALGQARQALAQHRPQHDIYLTRIETARQYETRQARLAQASQNLASRQEQLAAAEAMLQRAQEGYDAQGHAQARLRVEALSSEATRVRTELASRNERRAALEQEIGRLEGLQTTLHERLAARDETQGLQRLLEEMRALLHQAGPYITQQLVARISHQASGFFCDIMNDYTGRLTWSEDYDLSLEVNGRMRGFQQLSGGEQMSAALALRLALLRHLSNIDVAFFDEPTAHLDPERRDGLAEKIMQVKGFSQLFVISHDDTFERAAQSYLRVVKEDGASRVEAA